MKRTFIVTVDDRHIDVKMDAVEQNIKEQNVLIDNKNASKLIERQIIENNYQETKDLSFVLKRGILTIPILISLYFLYIAFFNSNKFFSFQLTVFSSVITIAFEVSEWIDKIHKKEKHINKEYKDKTIFPFILAFFLLILFFFIFNGFVELGFITNIPSCLPDVITSIILFAYFFSYYIRNRNAI